MKVVRCLDRWGRVSESICDGVIIEQGVWKGVEYLMSAKGSLPCLERGFARNSSQKAIYLVINVFQIGKK